jgi:cytochrome b-561
MEVHLLGATIGSEAIGGILLPGLVILGLALLPWLDRTNRAKLEYLEPPTWHPARLGWGVAFLALIGVFTLAAYDDELGLSKAGLRVAVVVVPLLAGGLAYLGARARAQRLAARSEGPAAAGAPAAPVIPSANQTATKGGST